MPSLKQTRYLYVAFAAAFLTFGFVALSLNVVQAAPPAQSGVGELVLPVTHTGNQTSVYTVTNLAATTPISTLHTFYAGGFPNGQIVALYSDTYNPSETKVYSLARLPNFPKDFVGDVVITADQPITGSVTIRPFVVVTPNQPTAATAGTTPILPPLIPPPIGLPEQVTINWTVVTYIVIGLFALSGFFKGWWKEAISTFFIAILLFFLAVPSAATWFIDLINSAINSIWEILANAGIVSGVPIQLDAGSGNTWLAILLLFIGLSIFMSRSGLSNIIRGPGRYHPYVVTPLGSVLGGLLGGLNGFLILNLIRHYLEGTNLPTSNQPATEIAMTSTDTVVTASSGVNIQFTNLPNFTVINAFLPWIIIAVIILFLFLTWKFREVPWGYAKYSIEAINKIIT
jgi:hypothetical protein